MNRFYFTAAFTLLITFTAVSQGGNRHYSLYAPAPVTTFYAPAPVTTFYAPIAQPAVVVRRPILRPFAPPAFFGVAAPVAAPVAATTIIPAPIAPVSHASPSFSGPVSAFYRAPIAVPTTSFYPPASSVYRPIFPAYGPVVYPRW